MIGVVFKVVYFPFVSHLKSSNLKTYSEKKYPVISDKTCRINVTEVGIPE